MKSFFLKCINLLKNKINTFPTHRYIKERKQTLQKEQQAKAATKYADCPLGHIPLPDNERKETLNMLKKSELNLFL